MNEVDLRLWIDEQHNLMTRLEDLLEKQADDHARYARESSERMHELNKMMENYVEIQRTHIESYVRHIDTATRSRDEALKAATMAMEALRDEQKKCHMLVELVRGTNTATVTVNKID